MTKRGIWPVRAMYTLVAVALVISLMITAAPPSAVLADAHNDVKAEWDMIDTPTTAGWVLAPETHIIDYALDANGEVAYAVVLGWNPKEDDGGYWLLKSTTHGATWTDITSNLEDLLGDDDDIDEILHVATDWVSGDFVAVALWVDWDDNGEQLHVFISNDGGSTFVDTGEVRDGSAYLYQVADLAVSHEADGKRDIAIGGQGDRLIFRCVITGDSPGPWRHAEFTGWDDENRPATAFNSIWVTDIIFSPSWVTDRTILVTTITPVNGVFNVHLQSGSWGATSQGWNYDSTLGMDAVEIMTNVDLPTWLADYDARAIAGITLPSNYNSRNPAQRVFWVWVNYWGDDGYSANQIMRVDNASAGPIGPLGRVQEGRLWLTNISYQGNVESGKAIAGILGTGRISRGDGWDSLLTPCCTGVQVYHNFGVYNMDICCERWKPACKAPTGRAAMAVSYVGGSKAYAVALWGFPGSFYDESAWSWTFDDGYNWNQLSLIDTWIDYISDVAVSPDCNKTMLVTVNDDYGCECDSVWLHAVNLPEAPEYSGRWIRTFSFHLDGEGWEGYEHGILRLNPEDTAGHHVYLVDLGTNKVYRDTLEGLGCWLPGTATIDSIVDLTVKNATTMYALGEDGKVAEGIADDYAITWSAAVDSKVTNGWTIAVWGDELLVGGQAGDVAHSSHGTGNFTALKSLGGGGYVTVAFDSYYGANDVIYAAQYRDYDDGDIYMWKAGESTSWINLGARPSTFQLTGAGSKTDSHTVAYTGLVLDRPSPGNPKTSPATGGVLYASYVTYHDGYYYTGVARALMPLMEIDDCALCPVEWDYLWVGLTPDVEGFEAMPKALKICGCLTADSYTKLFAVDWWNWYDWDYATGAVEEGAVWRFIDCYSKIGVDLRNPADGWLAPSDPCAGCWNAPFTINWDRVCDACVYEYQFATDASFDYLIYVVEDVLGSPAHNPTSLVPEGILQPGETYYWRVRARQAGTGQWIRSWWSDARSVTIAPALGTGVYLVAPGMGATGQPRMGIAFVWDSVSAFDSYNFVLSRNADFSAPDATANGLTTKAYTYTGANLAYDTPYYWRVTAIQDGAPASMAMGTFRTRPEAPAPVEPEPITTPFWVWVIIAIGAVLVIVVIVLIFRTRRV